MVWDRLIWYSKKYDQFLISDTWGRIHHGQPLCYMKYVTKSMVYIGEIK